ncbi:MAG TPA: hypothetical protein VF836_00820 [Gemmatimonadaceae bacterium]
MLTRPLDIVLSSFSLALASVLVVALPARVSAQAGTSVVSGITVHAAPPHGADTVVYQRSITRAGKDTTAGTRTVVSRVVDGPDRRQLLEVEQRFPAGGGEIVDTAVAELSTLRAVAHRSHQPARTMRFDFVGSEAAGTVTQVAAGGDSTKPEEAVHLQLGGPIFDSNVIDLVVASLPLGRGFSAELPFFIYERGGRVPMAVAVRERATVAFPKLGEHDAWIVTVGVPGAPATIWVDAKTRAVLRVRYDIAARGMSFTDDRVTPLRG